MGAHIGITSTYGVTLPSNAEPQSAQRTQDVALVPTMGSDGETAKLQCAATLKEEITIGYVGAPDFGNVTLAQNITPSTVQKIKAEMTEEPNKPNSGSITAVSHQAFVDSGGSGAGAGGGDTDIGIIAIKSVDFVLAENVRRSTEVKDVTVTAADGTPGWRGTVSKKNSFGVRFKGDIPSGLVIGTSGAGLYGFSGGVLAVSKLVEEQKHDDVNGGSYDGEHAPSAS